jgi:hypothetical protein
MSNSTDWANLDSAYERIVGTAIPLDLASFADPVAEPASAPGSAGEPEQASAPQQASAPEQAGGSARRPARAAIAGPRPRSPRRPWPAR